MAHSKPPSDELTEQALSALSQAYPDEREVYEMYHGKGMTQEAIAGRLRISQTTVSRRLKNAENKVAGYRRGTWRPEVGPITLSGVAQQLGMSRQALIKRIAWQVEGLREVALALNLDPNALIEAYQTVTSDKSLDAKVELLYHRVRPALITMSHDQKIPYETLRAQIVPNMVIDGKPLGYIPERILEYDRQLVETFGPKVFYTQP